jgi:hypothetical protein
MSMDDIAIAKAWKRISDKTADIDRAADEEQQIRAAAYAARIGSFA